MNNSRPAILVIIGITGDLSTRKLLPAIDQMLRSGAVPQKQLRILGITRRNITTADVLARLPQDTSREYLGQVIQMHQMDLDKVADYDHLGARLDAVQQEFGGRPAQRLFYLSVPPQISQPIVSCLGESGLAKGAKLLLEKPFGTDLPSAQELVEVTKRYFSEDQIYRIDHYLAKDIARQLLTFRQQGDGIWNNRSISRIDITATEHIGIEGRAAFYEQTGALRDFVQSHLLQLTALALMEAPRSDHLQEVPALRRAALHALHVPADQPVLGSVVRGQYEGYRTEVNNPHSTVETYVRLNLVSDDPRWQDVPICLTTGKALKNKCTEIRATHKQGKDTVFGDGGGQQPDPYTQVFLDAIHSKRTLFTSSDEVLETWRILEPVQKAWSMSSLDLLPYSQGSAGPEH